MEQVSTVSEPTSMKELYNTLYELGAIWREEHQYTVNEGKKNEKIVIPIPEVSTVAKYLRQVCHFAFISTGDSSDKSPLYLYHYDKGIYTDSADLFNKLCAKFDSRLKPRAWADIRAFIRTTTRISKPFSDHTRIPVANGVFNLKTKQLEPFSPDFVITSKIRTAYNGAARKPILDGWFDFERWLDIIACGDSEIYALLWQIMNEAINPNRTRGKLAILLGDGNNGKGTFQSLLMNLIGADKVATLRPNQFEGHNLASLSGKVCNIGDDISNRYIDEVSDLMSIVTGDTVTINPKHQQPFELSLKLFCLFSANELPRVRNKSQGWYRRLCIVPFKADFNGQKERPEIKNIFLKDTELLEWVLFKILNMPAFDKFIEPEAVAKEIDSYKKENDYLYAFVTDDYTERELHLIERVPLKWIKEEYRTFLAENDLSAHIPYSFGKDLVRILRVHTGGKYSLRQGRLKKKEAEVFPYPLTIAEYTEYPLRLVEKDE